VLGDCRPRHVRELAGAHPLTRHRSCFGRIRASRASYARRFHSGRRASVPAAPRRTLLIDRCGSAPGDELSDDHLSETRLPTWPNPTRTRATTTATRGRTATTERPGVTTDYRRSSPPSPSGASQAQFADFVQHPGNNEIQQLAGFAGDGETRTRTGGTTIFSRVELLLSPADVQGFSSVRLGLGRCPPPRLWCTGNLGSRTSSAGADVPAKRHMRAQTPRRYPRRLAMSECRCGATVLRQICRTARSDH
jgi:hypothetical protein